METKRHGWAGMRAAIALSVILVGTRTASADPKSEPSKRDCARAAETGQRLRDEGRPLASREQLLVCLNDACPTVVRTACARWLEDVERMVPTVVLEAHVTTDGVTSDVTDVSVEIDGVPTQTSLDGQPLRLEPGQHVARFRRRGLLVEQRFLLAAGEKNRLVSVDLAPPTRPGSETRPSPHDGGLSVSPVAWTLVGLTLVATGSFAYFGTTGKSDLDSLRATCAGHCTDASVSSAWNKLVVADVSLGVGIVSAAIATWLILTSSPKSPDAADRVTTGILVEPTPTGARVGYEGAF